MLQTAVSFTVQSPLHVLFNGPARVVEIFDHFFSQLGHRLGAAQLTREVSIGNMLAVKFCETLLHRFRDDLGLNNIPDARR